ncbi:MAG: hypothetical protein AAGL99_18655 [Pseudomonadota bacterium]
MTFLIVDNEDQTTEHIRGARIAAVTQEVIDARTHYRDCLVFSEIVKKKNLVGAATSAQRALDHALDMWLDARDKAESIGVDHKHLQL